MFANVLSKPAFHVFQVARQLSIDGGHLSQEGGEIQKSIPGWWFQPIWKIQYEPKWESSPFFGVKIKDLWNHHPDSHGNLRGPPPPNAMFPPRNSRPYDQELLTIGFP